ncbi:MAG: hypothetical protein QMD36_03520 [Candidatus Aenigmarchaeota archaeon]|nr:hypothetical protein [Candidatus Aenigmarchaeota archaeon]
MIFGKKKEKKEDVFKESFDIPIGIPETREEFKPLGEETRQEFKSMSEEILPLPMEEKKKVSELKEGTGRIELEELSQKVENELGKIDRRIKSLEKKADVITIDSQEIVDLIRLYAATNNKFQEFIDEMHRLEGRGWGIDENIAAFYKFRIGKALSNIKRQSIKVEGMCERVGFTPSKIREILDSSIEELVDSLMRQGSRRR